MKIFIGEYKHKMDGKGRITIPRKFRDDLGENPVLTCSFDGALELYCMADFAVYSKKLMELPFDDKENRKRVRKSLSMATDLSFDNLGRILMPKNLIEFASIKKDTVIIGIGNRIEIWDEESFREYIK